jgi:16S rRNA (uracil1498-N3)-methyltransferase
MARLFVAPERLEKDEIALLGEDYRYLCRVLRLSPGDEVTLFDGAGREARARLERDETRQILLRVLERRAAGVSDGLAITLLCGLPKGDKMDFIVQKATELGVSRIVPCRTARSIGGAELLRLANRHKRWVKIAREAARQCGRSDVPEIAPPVDWAAALGGAPEQALRLLFWEEARGAGLRKQLPETPPKAVVIAVGPEGGLDAAEVDRARTHGFVLCGLGPRTMRVETAALAALTMIGFALGDLG